MSDEPESTRFPRQVWDDFAVKAAQCGFTSCFWTLLIGMPYLFSLRNGPGVLTGTLIGMGVALVLALTAWLSSARYRQLGFVVVGASTFAGGMGVLAITGESGFLATLGVVGGYLLGMLTVIRPQIVLPVGDQVPGEAARLRRFQRGYSVTFGVLALLPNILAAGVMFARGYGVVLPAEIPAVAFWYVVVLSLILCVWCWLRFFRPFVELCLEPFFRTLYRVKAKGNLKQFPPFGPCLVIANHAFWLDPIVLAMILPRPVTPIMTQRFYDKWFLRPLLKYVFRVIVVPETMMKRETPELEQAVAALDRGEVVVIFPEGYLQRKEEVPLRRFGQGAWHILRARPDTPVVACWIEGGWGSFFSYRNGLPMKNKRMDLRRKIDIAVSAPEVVSAEVLVDQMATRVCLMNRVAGMRAELGLKPLPTFEVPRMSEHHEESA